LSLVYLHEYKTSSAGGAERSFKKRAPAAPEPLTFLRPFDWSSSQREAGGCYSCCCRYLSIEELCWCADVWTRASREGYPPRQSSALEPTSSRWSIISTHPCTSPPAPAAQTRLLHSARRPVLQRPWVDLWISSSPALPAWRHTHNHHSKSFRSDRTRTSRAVRKNRSSCTPLMCVGLFGISERVMMRNGPWYNHSSN
jgi:hypothetical protein